MSKKQRSNKDYDPQFREQAVNLILNENRSVSDVAKNLGVPHNTLYTWLYKFRRGEWSMLVGSPHSDPARKLDEGAESKSRLPSSSQKQHDRLRDLEASNRELEIKLRRMTQERDILKKAMAYCLDVPK